MLATDVKATELFKVSPDAVTDLSSMFGAIVLGVPADCSLATFSRSFSTLPAADMAIVSFSASVCAAAAVANVEIRTADTSARMLV